MKIGFSEIIIIFVVALIVIGPDKLPAYAKKLGEALREFRNVSNDLTKDLKETVIEPLEEAQKPIKEALQPMTEVTNDIKKNIDDVKKSVDDIGRPSAKKQEASEKDDKAPETAVSHEGDNAGELKKADYPSGSNASSEPEESLNSEESTETEKSEKDVSDENKFETVGHFRV